MERVIGALGGMAARARHFLSGPRVIDMFTDGVSEHAMFSMALAADIIDLSL